MNDFDLRKYLAENRLLKEDIDFPELEDEFEGYQDAMLGSDEEYLQGVIDAAPEEFLDLNGGYYEVALGVEQGRYSAEEAVKLAKAWAQDKLSGLAEGRLYQEDLTEDISLLQEDVLSQDELKDILASGVKGVEGDDEIIDKALKGELKDVKEALAVASVLVAPILIKLAGKLLNKIQSKLGSKNQSGDDLIKLGKALHKTYTLPVRLILQGIGGLAKKPNKFQDKAYRAKIANVIYAAVMIFVAGKGVVKGVQNFAGVKSALTVIFETVEGGGSITEVIAAAMEAVGAGAESLDAIDSVDIK